MLTAFVNYTTASGNTDVDIDIATTTNPSGAWNVATLQTGLTSASQYTIASVAFDGQNIVIASNDDSGSADYVAPLTAVTNGATLVPGVGGVTVNLNQTGVNPVVVSGGGVDYLISTQSNMANTFLTYQTYTTSGGFSAAQSGALANVDVGNIGNFYGNYSAPQANGAAAITIGNGQVGPLDYVSSGGQNYIYGVSEVMPSATAGTQPEFEWFELNVTGASPQYVQGGDISPTSLGLASDVAIYNASIAVDGAGDVLINFTASEATAAATSTTAAVAGMNPTDYYTIAPSGGSFGAAVAYQTSSTAFNGGASGQAWGGHSSAIVDPNNPTSGFYISNEYVTTSGWWDTVNAQVSVGTTITPPAAPTISAPSAGSTDTTTATPTISGTGIAGDTITLSIDGGAAVTTSVANDGTWSYTPASPLTNASHTVTATQAATGGTSSTAASDTFTVALAASAPTISSPTTGSTDTTTAEPVISGTGVAGDTITLSIDGGAAVTTSVAKDGTWSYTPASPLTNASHTVTATQAATGGTSSAAVSDTFTVDVPPPTVTLNDSSEASDVAAQTITGTVQSNDAATVSGATVTLYDNGTAFATTTVAGDGTFTASVTLPNSGANSIYAEVADSFGAIGTSAAFTDWFAIPGTPVTTNVASLVVTIGDDVDFVASGDADVLAVTGSGSAITASGSKDYVGLGGGSDWTQLGGSGDALNATGGGDYALVTGASDWISLSGTGDATTVSGSQDYVTLSGANEWAVLSGTGDAVAATGTMESVLLQGPNEWATLSGSGDAATLSGANDYAVLAGANQWASLGNAGDAVTASGAQDYVVLAANAEWAALNGAGDTAAVSGDSSFISFGGTAGTAISTGNNEVFAFAPAFGNDVITGFNATDTLQVSVADFASWNAMQGDIKQVNSDTVITLDANDSVTLKNFAATSLTSANFKFA